MILVQISVFAASRNYSKHVKIHRLSTHPRASPDSANKRRERTMPSNKTRIANITITFHCANSSLSNVILKYHIEKIWICYYVVGQIVLVTTKSVQYKSITLLT